MSRQSITDLLESIKGLNTKSKEFDAITHELWYDWFCADRALPNRARVLISALKAINESTLFDSDKTYVFFKNNCPMDGSLYDSFSICDIETGDVQFWVTKSSGFRADYGMAQVFGRSNEFKEELCWGSWKEVKDWFLQGTSIEESKCA